MCCMLSCFSPVRLFATPWTVALQAPLSMGFSRQEYWNGLSRSSPRNLPNTRTEPTSLKLPSLAGKFFTTSTTWEAIFFLCDSFDPNSLGHGDFYSHHMEEEMGSQMIEFKVTCPARVSYSLWIKWIYVTYCAT